MTIDTAGGTCSRALSLGLGMARPLAAAEELARSWPSARPASTAQAGVSAGAAGGGR